MYARDRVTGVLLLCAAVVAWIAVAWLVTDRSPTGQPAVQVAGALLFGLATGVTVTPLAWLAVFARRRIAYRGDWVRATRRGVLAGGTVTLLVLLQVLGVFSLPLGLFLVAMAIFVELILTARR